MKHLKGVVLTAAAAAAILVPLYGDPRQTPVTHPEWARMLLRGLDMEPVLVPGSAASLAFDSLSWRNSLGLPSDRPFRSVGVEFVEGPPRFVRALAGGPGELAYRVAAARQGDYRVRLRLQEQPATPVAIELTPEGGAAPVKSLDLIPVTPADGVATPFALYDSGGVYLSTGIYSLAVALPPGSSLLGVEVIPPCVNSIEPVGGWLPTAIAQTGDVAVTVLKALDLESELPPAAAPIDLPSLGFQPSTPRALKASLRDDLEGYWLQADANGVQAVAHLRLEQAGLYTIYGFGFAGTGQSWLADSCHKSVLCPATENPELPRWHPLLTAEFSAGQHSLATVLANGAAIQRLRIEQKKNSVEDYLGTLARIGLDLGSQRPIPRGLAVDAMRFVESRRRTASVKCGDVALPGDALVAGLAVPPGATLFSGTPGGVTPGTGPQAGLGPVAPLPGSIAPPTSGPTPSPEPSPAPSPEPSPTPVTTPPPTPPPPPPTTAPSPSPTPTTVDPPAPSPSPTFGPPPTTTPQPPATPVKD